MRPSFILSAVFPFVGSAVSPVVIIPGDGSNQLEAKIDKPSRVSLFCSKKKDWFRLWLSTQDLLLKTNCWADNIKLLYDEEKDELTNNVGVQTRVPDFGGTSSFEELDPAVPFHGTAVFRDMVMQFVRDGLERNVTLRGAPYDFRYAPSSKEGSAYTARLKALIEETAEAQGQRVSLISHSMGCLQVLYLLNQQTQQWKDQYVEKWIPIAGPFGGAASELVLFASGNDEGLPVNPLDIREEQRSYETNFWLAPVPQEFGDKTIIETPSRTYSAQDYNIFFEDIGYPVGKKLMQRVSGLTAGAAAPGVDVVCMYSLGVDTPLRYKYSSNDFDVSPEVINGDGDGTVNDFSLQICERWAENGAQSHSARVVRFNGIAHSDMLTDHSVIAELEKELGLSVSAVSV